MNCELHHVRASPAAGLGARAAYAQQAIRETLIDHKQYIARYGQDMKAIRDWVMEQGREREVFARKSGRYLTKKAALKRPSTRIASADVSPSCLLKS